MTEVGSASNDAPQVCLVVPCFNEADRLDPSAFWAFLEKRPELRLLFVDDGSVDGTASILRGLALRHPRIETLELPRNQGKGEAVRLGLLRALEQPVALVGYWDVDLATPLEELDRFTERFRANPRLEVLLGSRVRMLGYDIQRHTLRHYLGRIAGTLASSILGLQVYDTQCGAKLLRCTDALPEILAKPFLTRWLFDVELIARWLEARGGELEHVEIGIQEIPLQAWRDVPDSRIRPHEFVLVPVELLRIWRSIRRSRRLRNSAR